MSARRVVRLGGLAVGALALMAPVVLRGTAPPVLLNLTASLPGTVYFRVSRAPRAGEVVALCLPEDLGRFAVERGYVARGRRCPGGASPLLKHVAALAGARVRYQGERVVVDGVVQPESAMRQQDSQGRAMPVGAAAEYVVGEDEGLLLNPHALSFDGRYFGAVSLERVLGVYRALTPSAPLSRPARETSRPGERIEG